MIGDQFRATTVNERQDASIPYSARNSMQAAAAENPTENRVFDVTMLLEKIVADFNSFRNDVRQKVYELLTYGDGIFQSNKLAEVAWSLMDRFSNSKIQ